MLAPPFCSIRIQQGLKLRLTQPPNLYYSLDGVDSVKIFWIYTRIRKKYPHG